MNQTHQVDTYYLKNDTHGLVPHSGVALLICKTNILCRAQQWDSLK